MSAEACLALRMCGPLQSWGIDSRFNRRGTSTMPSRSAVAGILCASLGLDRGSAEEAAFLKEFSSIKMHAVSVQRVKGMPPSVEDAFLESVSDEGQKPVLRPVFPMKRMQDYHTVQGTLSADGKSLSNAVLTYRQYLTDAMFFIFLCGNGPLLKRLDGAIQDPVWGVWLGRKSCLPSAPLYAGTFTSMESARSTLLPGLCVLAEEEDSPAFNEGTDTLPDAPLDFSSSARRFGLRRVKRTY